MNDLKGPSKLNKMKSFIYRKRIYLIVSSIILLSIIIIIIISSSGGSNKKEKSNKEEQQNKDQEDIEEYEPISKYYSEKTKNYLQFVSTLEEENYIAYQYNFQNNSKGSFENTYQYLYENDTSLIPNNSEVGNYLFHEESYLKIETEEVNYYKNILKKDPPKHYIYGPSYIQEDYNKGQKLYNPNIKLNDTKD